MKYKGAKGRRKKRKEKEEKKKKKKKRVDDPTKATHVTNSLFLVSLVSVNLCQFKFES